MAWAYYLGQGATAAILLVAANTSFADFPRLAGLMARDRFLPAQFAHLGDRLVFANGIVVLARFAAVRVWVIGGDTSRLIPLYAVGVFLSFTLSQAGMVVHWWRLRGGSPTRHSASDDVADPGPQFATATEARGWRTSIAVNGLGAVAPAIVVAVFILTEFVHGAWIVVVPIPALVMLFRAIHDHYRHVGEQLELEGIRPVGTCRHNTVIVLFTRVHRGIGAALEYALCPSKVDAAGGRRRTWVRVPAAARPG